mgnify:CR=1 FL=1
MNADSDAQLALAIQAEEQKIERDKHHGTISALDGTARLASAKAAAVIEGWIMSGHLLLIIEKHGWHWQA